MNISLSIKKKFYPFVQKYSKMRKEKRRIWNSPKDGPIATQSSKSSEEPNQTTDLPRPSSILFNSRQTFSWWRWSTKKKGKKSGVSFVPRTFTSRFRTNSSAEVDDRCDGSCETWDARSLKKIAAGSRFLARKRSTPPAQRSRADSRNRARENERRRARVVAVWPGTGGHPAVYLPFDATCWIQRAKHGRGREGGERSTSARGVATPTPTRAVCKRSSVNDDAEGRFFLSLLGYRGSRIDFFSFLEEYKCFLVGDVVIFRKDMDIWGYCSFSFLISCDIYMKRWK